MLVPCRSAAVICSSICRVLLWRKERGELRALCQVGRETRALGYYQRNIVTREEALGARPAHVWPGHLPYHLVAQTILITPIIWFATATPAYSETMSGAAGPSHVNFRGVGLLLVDVQYDFIDGARECCLWRLRKSKAEAGRDTCRGRLTQGESLIGRSDTSVAVQGANDILAPTKHLIEAYPWALIAASQVSVNACGHGLVGASALHQLTGAGFSSHRRTTTRLAMYRLPRPTPMGQARSSRSLCRIPTAQERNEETQSRRCCGRTIAYRVPRAQRFTMRSCARWRRGSAAMASPFTLFKR